jgi:hypothetical protein
LYYVMAKPFSNDTLVYTIKAALRDEMGLALPF